MGSNSHPKVDKSAAFIMETGINPTELGSWYFIIYNIDTNSYLKMITAYIPHTRTDPRCNGTVDQHHKTFQINGGNNIPSRSF